MSLLSSSCFIVRKGHCCKAPNRSRYKLLVMSSSQIDPSGFHGRNEFCVRSGVANGLCSSTWTAKQRRHGATVAGPTASLKHSMHASAGQSPKTLVHQPCTGMVAYGSAKRFGIGFGTLCMSTAG